MAAFNSAAASISGSAAGGGGGGGGSGASSSGAKHGTQISICFRAIVDKIPKTATLSVGERQPFSDVRATVEKALGLAAGSIKCFMIDGDTIAKPADEDLEDEDMVEVKLKKK